MESIPQKKEEEINSNKDETVKKEESEININKNDKTDKEFTKKEKNCV